MTRSVSRTLAITLIAAGLSASFHPAVAPAEAPTPPEAAAPKPAVAAPPAALPLPSPQEARERADLLHGLVSDTLTVVHHAYYREDEGLPIPAVALKEVFGELATRRKVQLRWLVVDAQAMNVDHNPRDDFEKAAVKALLAGEPQHEETASGTYRRVAPISLTSECLKCHLPNRRSTKARTAALLISMPVRSDAPPE